MLHFLRRIRRSLIDSGATSRTVSSGPGAANPKKADSSVVEKPVASKAERYLLYAIGEVLLVMIGILLALQVNTWNESRKQRQLEVSLLLEMQENLRSDFQDVQYNIEEDSETLTSIHVILNHLENRLPFHDTLSRHYAYIVRSTTFLENTSAFQNLKSLGFNVISNDSLRQRITNLYSVKYQYVNEVNSQVIRQIIQDYLSPIMLENVQSKIVLKEAYPYNHDQLFENNPLKESLRWHRETKKFILDLYKDVANEIVELIQVINEEIGETK